MKKPTILLISGKNPMSARSGYGAYSYNLAKLLTSLNYQVKIFCIGEKSQIIESEIGIIHIKRSALIKIPLLKNMEMAALPFLAISLALDLDKQIQEKTIIWGIGPWSLSAAILKVFSRKKFVFLSDYFTSIKHEFQGNLDGVTIADYGIFLKLKLQLIYLSIIQLYTLLEKFLLAESDLIITHYSSTRKILSDQFQIPASKFRKIPYLVEIVEREKLADNQKLLQEISKKLPPKPIILLVSRHDYRKGINYLLHALSILEKKQLQFSAILIGNGQLFSANQKLAKKLGLKQIQILGFVPNLKPFLEASDIFVFPTIEEGSSALSLLEAMKSNLPIVSTNVDGISEDLQDQKQALLVPPQDPMKLANALEKLIKNPKLAKKLGAAGKKRYNQKYNSSLVKQELQKLLMNL
jgi:glycosyltransferase involved in cell wall biosynthesis